MKNLELMIDLEFMGKPPTAAITSIGAVLIDVDTLTIYSEFSCDVSLASSVKAGMTLDPETVLWWLRQDDSAREPFRTNAGAAPLDQALDLFNTWLNAETEWSWIKLGKVWGYGANADNLIMAHAFQLCGMDLPWTFREDRCFRTLMDDHQHKWVDYGTAHNAADDAMAQALTLIEVYRSQPGRVIEELTTTPPPAPSSDTTFAAFDDDIFF